MTPELTPNGFRDLPEWQAARADYLFDEGNPDEVLARRIPAAHRMREIERAYGSSVGGTT